jgi:2-methylcitrate dehydratase PrpD
MNAPLGVTSVASISQQFATHAVKTPYSAIPANVIDAAKLFLLDTLAVAWAGSDAPGCEAVYKLLVEEGGRQDATAWVYGGKLPVAAAAYMNGMSSAALDYDALGRESPIHVAITVFPAALAMAERQHTSGKDFLTALVLGWDIMYRLGETASQPHKGWSYTSAMGGFGAAAAASRLLGLDEVQARHALGMAFLQASGTQQFNIEPSLSKRMLSAVASRAGVFAAQLAQHGLTAPSEVIEGKFGFYSLYQGGDSRRALEGLGEHFESHSLTIKKYPSCGCNHTAIEGMLKLVRQHDLKPDDVESIEAVVTPYINRIVGGSYDPSGDAQVAAQFNIRYSLACALVRRTLGLLEIEAPAARDPKVAAHIGKVSVRVDPSLSTERAPIVLNVSTKKHGRLSCRVDHVPGSPEAPIAEDEMMEKFGECFGRGVRPLSSKQVEMLRARIHKIESLPDMATFFDGITGDRN